jgi:hypothetical protein
MNDRLAFAVEYASEQEAIDAVFVLGDVFEDMEDVESWQTNYKTDPDSSHTMFYGFVKIFFGSKESLARTARRMSEVTQATAGFIGGHAVIVKPEAD